MREVARKCAAEAMGTFALVFAGTGASVVDAVSGGQVTHVGVSLVWGMIVMAMVYAVGDVSGAHLNTAVTAGFWMAGRMRGSAVGPYVVSQAVGAFAASGLLRVMFGTAGKLGMTVPSGGWGQSLVMEMVLTGMLVWVILHVSTGPKETGVMAGIAVGAVVGLEAMFGGPVSGASMNPIRSVAPAVVMGEVGSVWIYVVGPLVGMAAAVGGWRLTRGAGRVAGA